MLRKSKIAAAMLMATATAGVNAAHVNTDGTGQVALLPYYNVNNNFITNVNIPTPRASTRLSSLDSVSPVSLPTCSTSTSTCRLLMSGTPPSV